MVQILPAAQRSPTVAQRLSQGVGRGLESGMQMMEQHQQKQQQSQQMQQENDAAKRMGVDLSGIHDPKMRQQAIQYAMQGMNERELETLKQKGKSDLAGMKNSKEDDVQQNLSSALGRIQAMRDLRKKGNLGTFSRVPGIFGGETSRDRGEYQTLGNSLISFATTIPIRNRQEFEKLAGHLGDPNITDAESMGILDGMERIIKDSLEKSELTPSSKESPKMSLQEIFG